jgi:hypothetical protein
VHEEMPRQAPVSAAGGGGVAAVDYRTLAIFRSFPLPRAEIIGLAVEAELMKPLPAGQVSATPVLAGPASSPERGRHPLGVRPTRAPSPGGSRVGRLLSLANGSGMPLACAADFADKVVRVSTIELREDVVEHEDGDADRRDSHANDHECLEDGHIDPRTRALPDLTLRITRYLRKTLPSAPRQLLQEHVAELGQRLRRIVEDGVSTSLPPFVARVVYRALASEVQLRATLVWARDCPSTAREYVLGGLPYGPEDIGDLDRLISAGEELLRTYESLIETGIAA